MKPFTKENIETRIYDLNNSYLMEDDPNFKQILNNQKIVDRFLEIYKNHIRDGAPTNKPELTKVDQSVIDQIQNIITKQLEYIKDGSIPEGYTSIRKPGN